MFTFQLKDVFEFGWPHIAHVPDCWLKFCFFPYTTAASLAGTFVDVGYGIAWSDSHFYGEGTRGDEMKPRRKTS